MRRSWHGVAVLVGSFVASNAICLEAAIAPSEIQQRWVGKTLLGSTASGGRVTMVLRPDGSAELSGAANDAGTWRLSENGYCTTWNKVRAGQERCFTAHRNGKAITVLNPDGSVSGTFTGIE